MSYNRNAETQRRLKRRYQSRYRVPIYFDDDKGRWVHYEFRSPKYRKYLKRLCNKRARRDIETYQQRGKYKRNFNFWNELI